MIPTILSVFELIILLFIIVWIKYFYFTGKYFQRDFTPGIFSQSKPPSGGKLWIKTFKKLTFLILKDQTQFNNLYMMTIENTDADAGDDDLRWWVGNPFPGHII